MDDLSYFYPVNNPSDLDRYEMLKNILKSKNREEDLENIIKLMSPREDISDISLIEKARDIKVAVIGAGEAGLSAALELRRIGCDITLFEASNRVGGRVYTYYFDRAKKHFGEFGPMKIPISHYSTWHYINLFNLDTSLFINKSEDSLLYIRGEKVFIGDKKYVIYDKFNLESKEKERVNLNYEHKFYYEYLNSLNPEARKELIEIKEEYLKVIKDLDKLTYRKAYEKSGFSEEAISLLGSLDGSDQFFSTSLIDILQQEYTLDSEVSYYVNDGMVKLPLLLYRALIDNNRYPYKDIEKDKLGNVTIKLGTPVKGIFESNNKISLKYKEKELNNYKLEEFDFVICTIPFTSLRRMDIDPIFKGKKIQAINEMDYENSQKIYMYFKERFWEKERDTKKTRGGSSFTDLPLVNIQYPSNYINDVENEDKSGVLLASYSSGSKALILGNEDYELQINDVRRYLEKIYNLDSNYLIENLIDYKSLIWSDVQYIWAAKSSLKPEYRTKFSYELSIPEMNNKLFFAGEHVSQKHGTQQGALQSGMLAASNLTKIIKERLTCKL